MPSTAGRVRMPHNNRVSTSGALNTSNIWSKTIGHDPYANGSEKQKDANTEADAEKARGLLELARHQNVAGDTTGRNDFAKRLYLGLKGGKKRRADETNDKNIGSYDILNQDSSSSEDEFVEVSAPKVVESERGDEKEAKENNDEKRRKKSKKKKRKKERRRRRRKDSDSDSDSDSESSEEEEERRRRRKKHRRREERKRRKKSYSSSSEEDR
mmetsp:Transcript_29637/g.42036  ORF Transcript_29637/g.42036 Transcript_29637/m.42036 type:complete len:213 (+) Transcript_29637:406-1044(+)